MPTEADVGNMALSKLGTRATITSLTENSTESRSLKAWYDTLRDGLLRKVAPNFARIYQPLALGGTSPTRWGYSYAYPSDCLKFERIDSGISVRSVDPAAIFEIGRAGSNRFIWANSDQAVGVYIQRVTDPNAYDPEFTVAFVTLLASAVALPITQKVDIRNSLLAEARALVEAAEVDSANEQVNNDASRVAESLAVRGYDDASWFNSLIGPA